MTAQPEQTPGTEPDEPTGMPERDRDAFVRSLTVDEPYTLGADSLPQDGVPRGTVTQHHWTSHTVYPGTERDYWVYVPAQYDPANPACLMVFQDGGEQYLSPKIDVPTVFDNLIHQRAMPVTIGVFVNPGDRGPGEEIYGGDDNRSLEYDALDDRYVRFLLDELLPTVRAQYAIVDDPEGHAICGISSGGICAFTAAWQRPDAFGKVVSHCGSFTNIRGGHRYPSMIRRTPRKPLRIFLQSGSNDVDVIYGSWPIANQDMAAALAYRDYDYQFVFGEGGHSLAHGGAIFPDTLRWLWHDYPTAR